jgi:mannose-6-phosphate isomerase-like protein (cupin superfamily)
MASQKAQRGISLHMAADAQSMADAGFYELSEEQLVPVMLEAEAFGLGNQTTMLVRDAGGFGLVHVWFKANYPLPRHSHSHDCMYYVISGSAIMGSRTLGAGDSFFVPSGAPYQYVAGPEGVEVLEIRYGAAETTIDVYETHDRIRERVAGALEANRETWEAATTSPTFVANASGAPTASEAADASS